MSVRADYAQALAAALPLRSVDVDPVDAAQAQALWERAPLATAFTQARVLAALAGEVDWWLASIHGQSACLWPVCRGATGPALPPPLSYYVGPLWTQCPRQSPSHRAVIYRLAAHSALLRQLSVRYPGFAGSLPPTLDDLRAFIWWNDIHGRTSLRLTPRHTALITGLAGSSADNLIAQFNPKRRREVRAAEQAGLRRLSAVDPAEVLALYRHALGRQHTAAVGDDRLRALRKLLGLTATGCAEVVAIAGPHSDAVLGAQLMLYGRDRVELVASGALGSDAERSVVDTAMIVAALDAARARGLDVVDFNGANSPQRAFRKHSYGARPALYFDFQHVV